MRDKNLEYKLGYTGNSYRIIAYLIGANNTRIPLEKDVNQRAHTSLDVPVYSSFETSDPGIAVQIPQLLNSGTFGLKVSESALQYYPITIQELLALYNRQIYSSMLR